MIRDDATQAQVDAAMPMTSTWLSANAGSGKTRVLTDRVARLLLEEVEPQNILCLTYTKAAAAEMQNRLFKRLGKWAMLPDADLRRDLTELGVEGGINDKQLSDARTLFARAIETPGGLKIQTIHSFCAAILRRFPVEAQVSPQFREMEDRQAALLRMEVLDGMVTGGHADIVAGLLQHFTGAELDKFVAEIAGKRGAFRRPFDRVALCETLEIPQDATRETALQIAFTGSEAGLVQDITVAFAGLTATYTKFAAELSALSLSSPDWSDFEAAKKLLLYADGLRSKSANFPQSNHKKAVDAAAPITEELHDWMDRVSAAQALLLSFDVFDRTAALYNFASAFVTAYEARKLAMGMLDFDDLIAKARDLLTDPAVAQWVLYRLDGGIDHVLVDEAQDTSPTQWAVIEHLTKEFASGEGARANRPRTVFVVGDKKQSIYSFQGADPDEFDRMQAYFADALEQAESSLAERVLQHSFRSSQAVLRVVDNTFWGDRADGLGKNVFHTAFKADMPGRVDLWDVIEKAEDPKPKEWYLPVDAVSDTHHNVQLANQVAAQIQRMIQSETIPEEIGNTGVYRSRNITEGDFLILVQRRSDLFSEIIRACKQADLQIAGADRLRVGAELAVKDIAALLSFLALPEDDLSLACALRSPLFGWTEKQLYDLAQPRPDKGYLWTALRDSTDRPNTLAMLGDLRQNADFLRPYDLIERILTRHDGRRNLLARLGTEAEDGIDALLSQALSYEQNGVPSLTGFLSWLETDALEVKRQMDAQGDRIRVMTVHGSKGLEAPIVILPECSKRKPPTTPDIIPSGNGVIWRPKSDATPPAVQALKEQITEAQLRERMRLLYVAMTRAEKWLIVAAAGDVGKGDDSWYTIVEDGMSRSDHATAMAGDLTIRRVADLPWQCGETDAKAAVKSAAMSLPVLKTLPDIVDQKTLSPSDLGGAKIIPGDPAGDDLDAALARGTAMHLLLEHLPNQTAAKRHAVGVTLLSALPEFHDEKAADALIADAIAIIANPALADVFAPAVLAEAGITANVPALGNRRIHGTIDRLRITETGIWAIDFKTNRLVPDTPDTVPEGVLRQQGAYAAALAEIYPNHRIETAILWTQTATLMPLPAQIIAAALGRVTTS